MAKKKPKNADHPVPPEIAKNIAFYGEIEGKRLVWVRTTPPPTESEFRGIVEMFLNEQEKNKRRCGRTRNEKRDADIYRLKTEENKKLTTIARMKGMTLDAVKKALSRFRRNLTKGDKTVPSP